MQELTFVLTTRDQTPVFVRRWMADGTEPTSARAAVQIAHGMGEHSQRYARFAEALVGAGYVVYANDHRGHGHTAPSPEMYGDFGPGGWLGLVHDQLDLGEFIDTETGGLPRCVFAHSMGSFALQQLLLDHSSHLAAAILSGTSAVDALAAIAPVDDTPADLNSFNVPFEPARTQSDWLSRDDVEVDKYVADPMCGFGVDAKGLRGMAADAARACDPATLAGIRSDLPLLMVSGSADPLAGGLALVETVAQRYRDAGMTNVMAIWYTDARHELLNEINRDEVTTDILNWLGKNL
jgi:alpha-beta hydrolase superfamily lysophospholipase